MLVYCNISPFNHHVYVCSCVQCTDMISCVRIVFMPTVTGQCVVELTASSETKELAHFEVQGTSLNVPSFANIVTLGRQMCVLC